MFKLSVAAVLATLSLFSMVSVSAGEVLVLHNGQNITFDYEGEVLPEPNLFGLGLLRTGAAIPAKVTSDTWEGPITLNIFDQDVIPATFVLQYPFFENGSSYTAQLFQYDTTTLEVAVPNVRSATFIWVNKPGQNV
ncbi:hypothetical protein DFH09DRAFT_1293881 [Mycena vulgaris]|nr:hypothetical protein DFH09DRAFT_1293881 [Mycena vulgaris]